MRKLSRNLTILNRNQLKVTFSISLFSFWSLENQLSQCCIMHMTCNNIYIQAQAAILKQGIRQPSATHLLKVYTYFCAFNHEEPDANYYKKHSDTNHSIFSNIQNFFGQKNFFLKFLSIFFTDCDTLGKETLLQLLHRISNYLQNIRALSSISPLNCVAQLNLLVGSEILGFNISFGGYWNGPLAS